MEILSENFNTDKQSGAAINKHDTCLYRRLVLVNFIDDITPQIKNYFIDGLLKLRQCTPNLHQMRYAENIDLNNESILSESVPNMLNPDFISIWSFKTSQDLNAFIENPDHKIIAMKHFKPAVKKRTVLNCYL